MAAEGDSASARRRLGRFFAADAAVEVAISTSCMPRDCGQYRRAAAEVFPTPLLQLLLQGAAPSNSAGAASLADTVSLKALLPFRRARQNCASVDGGRRCW